MAVICYPCVYISLGDAALARARVLKISCYCSQNAVLQIAQNGLGWGGLGGWGLGGWGLGLTGFRPAGGPEFPPSCGSGPVAVGSGLWGRSQSLSQLSSHAARERETTRTTRIHKVEKNGPPARKSKSNPVHTGTSLASCTPFTLYRLSIPRTRRD